ncbi:hypothetical protein AVHY2522_04065 [Acidovorax sp. SUPP2522]|uniref:hypothetical protein n=1 Tax=unclassified Acidovorax TaxID=2684926 RepID=UPI002349AC64|nr:MULTISPECIES: hypothetical protein [unclassified Acidovorax]WCM99728.1 hypothetical protein M5C96_10180 [Acidovorax sp. GBBC 1281]GKT14304.1 hypothetical protein AVHY2522_04065 [Acidovorax sp. SUPP2522]
MNTRSPDAFPFPTSESHPSPAPEGTAPALRATADPAHTEPALDHGIEESFPASDPLSIAVTQVHVLPPLDLQSLPHAQKRQETTARSVMSVGLMAGTLASFASTVVLAWWGRHEVGTTGTVGRWVEPADGTPRLGDDRSQRSMATICATFAAGIAVGCAVARRCQRSRRENA